MQFVFAYFVLHRTRTHRMTYAFVPPPLPGRLAPAAPGPQNRSILLSECAISPPRRKATRAPPLRTAPTTLPHFYHRGLLLLSPSCYCLSVALASEFGRIVVLPHPDGLDEINSDRADARGLTVSGGGMLLRRGSNSALTPLSYYPHSAPLSEPNRRKPPWQIWEISQSCSEFSDFYCIAA